MRRRSSGSVLSILEFAKNKMKHLFAICLFFLTANVFGDELEDRIAAVPNPRAINSTWVADPAGVIARRTGEINQLIAQLESKTSVEVAVVVLPSIGQFVPKDFAVALFEKWGIGKKGQDNGILILHVLDQRRIEMEVGYGLEGVIPDIKAFWITEEIAVPFFKQESFADGHYEVVRAVSRAIEQPEIKHEQLVSGWSTEPGANTDDVPSLPVKDAIALQYASAPERIFFNGWTPVVLLGVGGLFYAIVTLMFKARTRGKPPYAQYQMFTGGLSRMQYAASLPVAASALVFEGAHTDTLFSPLPVLVGIIIALFRSRSKKLKALRDAPRTCECGKSMRRLSEREDDAYLEKGHVAEESIGSVDYDVWVCDCDKFAIESYKGKTSAQKCTKCSYKTYRVTNTRTLKSATTSSSGLREVTHKCANCDYTKVTNEVIPQISTSSSSGGSSGSSGSSFGGGRSGGGGAGSSY